MVAKISKNDLTGTVCQGAATKRYRGPPFERCTLSQIGITALVAPSPAILRFSQQQSSCCCSRPKTSLRIFSFKPLRSIHIRLPPFNKTLLRACLLLLLALSYSSLIILFLAEPSSELPFSRSLYVPLGSSLIPPSTSVSCPLFFIRPITCHQLTIAQSIIPPIFSPSAYSTPWVSVPFPSLPVNSG